MLTAVLPTELVLRAPTYLSWPTITIHQAMLNYAVRSQAPQLGFARGESTPEIVLDMKEQADRELTVSIRLGSNDRYEFIVRVAPPEAGTIRLRCGDIQKHAPFDSHGKAVIREMPANFYVTDTMPDVIIDIETATSTQS